MIDPIEVLLKPKTHDDFEPIWIKKKMASINGYENKFKSTNLLSKFLLTIWNLIWKMLKKKK